MTAPNDSAYELLCVHCGNPIPAFDGQPPQPTDGTAFTTRGHYGSFFDPMDGAALMVAFCSTCLGLVAIHGRVLLIEPVKSVPAPPVVSRWEP